MFRYYSNHTSQVRFHYTSESHQSYVFKRMKFLFCFFFTAIRFHKNKSSNANSCMKFIHRVNQLEIKQ